jgi:hypothetical protein
MLTGLSPSWRQLAGGAGIAGVLFFLVTLGVLGMEEEYPDINRSIGEVRIWFEDNGTVAQTLSYSHAIILLFLFMPFFLGMRSMLAEAEGEHATWTQLGFFGGAIFVLLSLVAMAYTSVLAVAVDDLDDGTLTAFRYAEYTTIGVAYGLGSGLYLIGTGAAILRTKVLWRPLGWLALILGFVSVIGTANLVDPDPESLLNGLNFLGGVLGFGVVVLLQGFGLLTRR